MIKYHQRERDFRTYEEWETLLDWMRDEGMRPDNAREFSIVGEGVAAVTYFVRDPDGHLVTTRDGAGKLDVLTRVETVKVSTPPPWLPLTHDSTESSPPRA